ncbi:response regulator transcription factor [Paludibaculum fermentans]|uniref:Response regulator n=1 Tax=Paludibaculum fermentans TaxID=1473598 RepID=A0A7S7SIP6_PALFE|nr:response regulator [Paludibaculum fermentans]QOY85898.1 response regulator [Paludibaculum fermentans]
MGLSQFLIGVVDDDHSMRQSLEELLASGGYNVLLYSSAREFLDSDGFQRVSCLITDVEMPAISGWELLRMARTDHSELPVILITAEEPDDPESRFEFQGARFSFKKPFDGRALLAALDSIFRKA